MNLQRSVSIRLILTMLLVTLGSLAGFFITLNTVLKQFFIQDAQANLKRYSNTLAIGVHQHWNNFTFAQQLADLLSQQAKVQVLIFDATAMIRVRSKGVTDATAIELPANLIPQILQGKSHEGLFWVESDLMYSQWLYSTSLIRSTNSNDIIGAVYVAMPLRRPRQLAQHLQIMIMTMAVASTTIATMAGLLLSRTFTSPLQALHHQAQQLEAGNYTARSALKGNDELAQLSRLLDQMAGKLLQTLESLQAQENARRELVTNVSHDLRTPLTSLRIGLEAIIDGVVTGEKVQEYLKRACRETDYLTNLVEQLLLLCKVDAGQLQIQAQEVSLVAIAQECVFRMQPIARLADLNLELHIHSPAILVYVDPELTGQAILNLLDNAIKYASDGKLIQLNVLSPVQQDQHQYIPLQIQDYGQGMEENTLQRVTERFYRGTNGRPKGGLGLGLSIANNICQLQGGFLSLESEVNRGTIVTLFLRTIPKDRTNFS